MRRNKRKDKLWHIRQVKGKIEPRRIRKEKKAKERQDKKRIINDYYKIVKMVFRMN